jgi:nucleotide-binding universal stress UspA family protein
MADGASRGIVVGTDGSAEAERALERAAKLAASSGAPLYIVTAYSDDWPLKERLGDSARVDPVDLGRVAEGVLARSAEHVRRHGVEAEVIARHGDAAGALIDVAAEKGADLLVVGSRGLNAVDRFLLGSVSQKVSQHAKCTVMIVRDDGHDG